MSKRIRTRKPRGLNYAKSLVLNKKIKGLERELSGIDAKIAGCEIVTYDGEDHTFQPFWTLAPRAYTRPILTSPNGEVKG